MVGASTSVYQFDSVVRGYHIYRTTPLIDGTLQVVWEDANEHNEYSVAITKGGCIVGNISRDEISKICIFFLPCGTILMLIQL